MSVGRANANTLRIRDERVAAHHVRIEREDSRYVLEVTAGDVPTTLNGTKLEAGDRRELSDGDLIGLADVGLRAHIMGWHPARAEEVLHVLGRFPGCAAACEPRLGSDHVRFYLHNIPAILFRADRPSVAIHTDADTIEVMGRDELALAAEVMAAVAQHLAGPSSPA